MVSRTFLRLLAPALLLLAPSSSHSDNVDDGSIFLFDGSVLRTAIGDDALTLATRSSWTQFKARNGAWRALWNVSTGTPHRAIGPPIALSGYANDSPTVDRAVRNFIAAESGVFGAPTLETVMCKRFGNVWVVRYRQRIAG